MTKLLLLSFMCISLQLAGCAGNPIKDARQMRVPVAVVPEMERNGDYRIVIRYPEKYSTEAKGLLLNQNYNWKEHMFGEIAVRSQYSANALYQILRNKLPNSFVSLEPVTIDVKKDRTGTYNGQVYVIDHDRLFGYSDVEQPGGTIYLDIQCYYGSSTPPLRVYSDGSALRDYACFGRWESLSFVLYTP